MKDVDGVLHDHTALDRHIMLFSEKLEAADDGAEVALGALADEMHAHMEDEEGRLFTRAADILGEDHAGLAKLRKQHKDLVELLAAVRSTPAAERQAAFERFKTAFDTHTLSEADLFGRIWDEMFPGRMMGG